MPAMISVSAEVPQAQIDAFAKACDRYRTELGNTQVQAIRRGTIALIKSLRARTAKAKKQAPMSDVKKYDGPGPHYITPKGKKQKSLHRYSVRRRAEQDERFYAVPAENKTAARKRSGQYTKWGLARKSWGWFMQSLFHRANPESQNPRAVIRDGVTEGRFDVRTGENPRVEVLIVNKLKYIRRAVPNGAVEEAVESATRSINAQIDKGLAKARKELE